MEGKGTEEGKGRKGKTKEHITKEGKDKTKEDKILSLSIPLTLYFFMKVIEEYTQVKSRFGAVFRDAQNLSPRKVACGGA